MAVVGTAGHVDHGKTLLIRALTGMDTDRLPEEKQRGMTIDLGFAHFLDPHGNPIGVIDVPGHERYIRNMVAGAWGMDCALLLVAADDGWMPQTEAHARVLSVFQVPKIILVLNKIDTVSRERIEEVEEDALNRCETLLGRAVPVVRVSARTGEGVGLLKEVIVTELKKNDSIPRILAGNDTGSSASMGSLGANSSNRKRIEALHIPARLWIDRVFSLKGSGTIVAGSLRRGKIHLKEELLLLPRKEYVRVRRIQSYHRDFEEVVADEYTGSIRVALNLSGNSTPPERGEFLVGFSPECPQEERRKWDSSLEVQKEFLSVGYLYSNVRPQQEAEIAYGTAHRKVTLYRLKGETFKEPSSGGNPRRAALDPGNGELLRVVLQQSAFILPGDRFLLMRPGGADILGWGEVLWVGKTTPKERSRVVSLLMNLQRVPRTDEVEETIKGKHGARIVSEEQVKRMIEKEPDAHFGNKIDKLNAPPSKRAKGGTVFLPDRTEKLYREIRASGAKPWELLAGRGTSLRADIDLLCKEGMIVPLDSSLFLEAQAYRSLLGSLLKNRSVGSLITLAEAKQVTSLSRKYLLPFLNRMERDGWVKRRGDDRVICKAWIEEPKRKDQGEE